MGFDKRNNCRGGVSGRVMTSSLSLNLVFVGPRITTTGQRDVVAGLCLVEYGYLTNAGPS
jgi:hypothetical protein